MTNRKQRRAEAFKTSTLAAQRKLRDEANKAYLAQQEMERQRVTYKAVASFDRMDDAQAIKELLSEMGVEVVIEVTQNNKTLSVDRTKYVASDTRLGKLMLEYMKRAPGRIFTADDFASLLMQRDYKPNSANPMLFKMAQEKHVVKVARGEYMLAGPDCEAVVNRRKR